MSNIAALKFSKDWTNPSDFPATEPDEGQARADMQLLFNEVRDYINEVLAPSIPGGDISGPLVMRGFRVTGVGAPVENSDAATKEYVDGKKAIRATATIGTSWSGSTAPYTQVIPVTGVEADSIVEVSLRSTATAAQAKAYSALMLQDGGQASGSITLRCFGTKNTVSIPINIVVRRD